MGHPIELTRGDGIVLTSLTSLLLNFQKNSLISKKIFQPLISNFWHLILSVGRNMVILWLENQD